MHRQTSVFHQITKHIDWSAFDRIVGEHKADYRTRKCSSRTQFLALLFGQLSGATSLREIEAGLKSHEGLLYHAGAKTVARSTLSDANNSRSWRLFADMFASMVVKGGRPVRRRFGKGLRLLDATRIALGGTGSGWARFSDHDTSAKIHIVYDPETERPLKADITPYKVSDITVAKAQPIEPGTTYVFDMAYYDYRWWAELDTHNCRFVTRLKSHTHLRECAPQDISGCPEHILYDQVGYLPKRLKYSRTNPMAKPVREVGVTLPTGKTIRIVCNDLSASATEIADLYKARWQIELFFKWIKQNLKIRHFIGTSYNAVCIQVYVALIAYLLLHRIKATQTAIPKHITFIRLVRLNIMHRRPITNLAKPYRPPPKTTQSSNKQLKLC